MLSKEIEQAQRLVKTDAYQMSIGEIVSMYDNKELIIDPEFQRLFRWEIGQKSKLIESLLLGIPLPPIFVFEKEDGNWELIDGLQRISTILEFMGKLKSPEGDIQAPSVLEATKYLPSLHNAVWEENEAIALPDTEVQVPIDKPQQLTIRRARLGLEILKRPSDDLTKFDLFQRLNAGGTTANAQELRNCVMIMVDPALFRKVKLSAERQSFKRVVNISDDQHKKERHMELAVRFLVEAYIPYGGMLDVEEFIDEGIIHLFKNSDVTKAISVMDSTFDLLDLVAGDNVLRRYDGESHSGRISLTGFEVIAVGVAQNIEAISALPDAAGFVRERMQAFWKRPEAATFTAPGLRGTTRISRTIPFGKGWFKP